LIKKPKVSCN